jgi:hypothetical protein
MRTEQSELLDYLSQPPIILPELFRFGERPHQRDGVEINAYGQGKVAGATYTVGPRTQANVSFAFDMMCVTPNDIQALSALIRSLLDAPHQHRYDELERAGISGGASLFCFFTLGVPASYSKTKQTMDSWGLSEANQARIIEAMMALSQKTNHFAFEGTVYNRYSAHAVSGSIFAIVMDATIQKSEKHEQYRFLAPKVHLRSDDGTSLPCVGKLYN